LKAIYYCYFTSPLGQLCAVSEGDFIRGLYMPQHKGWPGVNESWRHSEEPFIAVRQQLVEYFSGKRRRFDVSLKLSGTPFQQRVWRELARIPLGETITYSDLAQRIGKPRARRAVGAANGRNPISILVPCHRVIGVNEKLAGYAGGIDSKRWLLALERNGVRAGARQLRVRSARPGAMAKREQLLNASAL